MYASLFRQFFSNRQGNIAIIFGFALIPFLLAVGLAVDFGQSVRTKSDMQLALDSAALATATQTDLEDSDRIAYGVQMFHHNFDSQAHRVNATPNIQIVSNKIVASATATLNNSFMKLSGASGTDVAVSVEVPLPGIAKAEVVLVLDYSSSMNSDGKWQAMRDAAVDLVTDLSGNLTNPDVSFGLVPFAKLVRVTMPSDYVIGEAPGGTWTGCTQDRKHDFNTKDSTPVAADDDTKWGLTPTASGTCHQMVPHNLNILPLTNDHLVVKNQLLAMDPHVGTHISLGLSFGYHLISPNEPFTQGVAYSDPDVQKVIVLLTDGRQTTKAWGPSGSHSKTNGEANLEATCQAIKDDDVLMITVAFDLNHQSTEDRLRDCATEPKFFFDADDNADLALAFEQIGQQLAQSLHISK